MNNWITPAAASAPKSALSGPRTTSMRSSPSEVRFSRCIRTARIVERHAIQQHQRAGAVGAARKYFGQRSRRAIFVDLQARNLTEQVEDHGILARLELLLGDDIGSDSGLLRRRLGAVRGDHNGFGTPR